MGVSAVPAPERQEGHEALRALPLLGVPRAAVRHCQQQRDEPLPQVWQRAEAQPTVPIELETKLVVFFGVVSTRATETAASVGGQAQAQGPAAVAAAGTAPHGDVSQDGAGADGAVFDPPVGRAGGSSVSQ
jgi:hypothetical protein